MASGIGIHVPTLCHMKLDDLNIENKPGGCRICVVEVEGRRNLAPACCTNVHEGMEVNTHSLRAINARRTVMELILSDHPADCLICAKSNHFEPSCGSLFTIRKDGVVSAISRCRLCT